MAWDEWEQLKADAAQRHTTRMQLNQLGNGGGAGNTSGGDGGTLQHSDPPWNHAAGVADALHTSMNTAKLDLDSADKGTSAGLAGLASLGSLTTILTSWDDRLSAVQGECKALQPALLSVSKELGETDKAVGSKTSSVHAPDSWKGN